MSKQVTTNESSFLGSVDYKVLIPTCALLALALFFAVTDTEAFGKAFNGIRSWIIKDLSWSYKLIYVFYYVVAIWLACSRYGDLKLGLPEDKPEFSFGSWIAMLFSCAIGLGFIFWGVAEPMYHFMNTPHTAASGTAAAAPVAIAITVFHWGAHQWVAYVAVGLAIAYPAFRYGKPMMISTALYGLLGDRFKNSWWAKVLEIMGAFAAIGGVATMLGLGILSLTYGFKSLFGIEMGMTGQILFLLFIVAAYVLSASSGLNKGIKILSNTNMYTAFIWVIFIIVAGPTTFIFDHITESFGLYLKNIVWWSFWNDAAGTANGWQDWWTKFYFIWTISFAPFVGGFLARISRGRTIREFVLGAIVPPTLAIAFFFGLMGSSSIYVELNQIAPLWESIQANYGAGIFVLLETYPMGYFLSLLVVFNLIIFLVTSADSTSFFVAMQMSGGDLNPKITMRLFWGALIGILAIVLLVSGGMKALQSCAVVAGAPFGFALVAMVVSLIKNLKDDVNNKGITK